MTNRNAGENDIDIRDLGEEESVHKSNNTTKKKKVQTILNFQSTTPKSTTTTCSECGMTYYFRIPKDTEVHKKYHYEFVNGILWPETLSTNVIKEISIMVSSKSGKGLKSTVKRIPQQVQLVLVNKGLRRQVAKTLQLLQMVNQELNAPEDSQLWKDDTEDVAKAFVLVIDNRAVGICTTDPIKDVKEQSRWMIHKTQSLVPGQVNQVVRVGISRIWVAPKWRRFGLARELLQAVLDHSIYGIKLHKNQIAFSQPSYSGGVLAKSFNGVVHKSGEVLVPVYLE